MEQQEIKLEGFDQCEHKAQIRQLEIMLDVCLDYSHAELISSAKIQKV